MKKVSFERIDKGHVVVYVDDENYGDLDYDSENKEWVLWPNQIDDGISYWESLKESEDEIKFELESY